MPASFSACERVMVLIGDSFFSRVPDFLVVARLAARAQRQNDAVEHDLPEQRIVLDHAPVGEKLLQIAAHGGRIGRIGRAEIDQKHADAVLDRRRLAWAWRPRARLGWATRRLDVRAALLARRDERGASAEPELAVCSRAPARDRRPAARLGEFGTSGSSARRLRPQGGGRTVMRSGPQFRLRSQCRRAAGHRRIIRSSASRGGSAALRSAQS